MKEQVIKKQLAREYYNVLYGAKLHYSSFDLCEKLPTFISVISMSFGVLGLAFPGFNSQSLGAILLIIGIIGITLKPREILKQGYKTTGDKLNEIGKKIEILYFDVDEQDKETILKARTELTNLQDEHQAIQTLPPVLLSSWFAHYKLFSEHNSDWMCSELGLGFSDKVPLSLRFLVAIIIIFSVLWFNPFCITTKLCEQISDPCIGCPQSNDDDGPLNQNGNTSSSFNQTN